MLDDRTWTKLDMPNTPPNFLAAGMAYMDGMGKTVLCGGGAGLLRERDPAGWSGRHGSGPGSLAEALPSLEPVLAPFIIEKSYKSDRLTLE